MAQTRQAPSVSLDLEIEDLELRHHHCCDTSTTNPLCTCPIKLTDCCNMVEMAQD